MGFAEKIMGIWQGEGPTPEQALPAQEQQETPASEEAATEGKEGAASVEVSTDAPEPAQDEEKTSYTKEEVMKIIGQRKKEWDVTNPVVAPLNANNPISPLEQEVAELKKELAFRELREEMVMSMEKAGYPIELAQLFNYATRETAEQSLEMVQRVFADELSKTMKQKRIGKTPPGLGGAKPQGAGNDFKNALYKPST